MTSNGQSTTARGYGWKHQQLRKAVGYQVAAGRAVCWRCHKLIMPGEDWDLGHDDHDRTVYRGPEHAECNRSAGGSASGRGNRKRRRPVADSTATSKPMRDELPDGVREKLRAELAIAGRRELPGDAWRLENYGSIHGPAPRWSDEFRADADPTQKNALIAERRRLGLP
jgi:hypothetical protein